MRPRVSVVDRCAYARQGWEALLAGAGPLCVWAGPGAGVVGMWPPAEHGCLVLSLATGVQTALAQLLALDNAHLVQAGYTRLVVVTPFAVEAVREVLRCCAIRVPVHIVRAQTPLSTLYRVIVTPSGQGEQLRCTATQVLSPPERRALLCSVQAIPVHRQAQRQKRSAKTVYTQRDSGLRKLRAAGVSALFRRFTS